MDFFQAQDQARKKTGLLIFYFTIAILAIMISIDALVVLLMQEGFSFKIKWGWDLFKIRELWYLNLGILLIIILPSIYKYSILSRGGGSALAKMINAQPILSDTQNLQEQILIHIVEEMSIAAGIPAPQLYVLEDQSGINAFVAGTQTSGTILVVTRAAIEHLNRDELQGVIGHEFSHVFHNDMSINLQLMGILSGIFVLSQVGYYLMRLSGSGSNRSKNSKNNTQFKLVVLGIGIYCIGFIGLLCGRLIKSAILRQRELLADASSVQFTRNPSGLVGALMKIQSHSSKLETSYAEEISHFCIAPPNDSRYLKWFGFNSGPFATHPPLQKRIQKLDPSGELQRSLTKTN